MRLSQSRNGAAANDKEQSQFNKTETDLRQKEEFSSLIKEPMINHKNQATPDSPDGDDEVPMPDEAADPSQEEAEAEVETEAREAESNDELKEYDHFD